MLEFWQYWQRKGGHALSVTDRVGCDRAATALRRLAPMRHLIAIAHDPVKATDGEFASVTEALSALIEAHPELRNAAHDVAFIIELADELERLQGPALAKLFALYEKLVDGEPTINTLLVNYARDHRVTHTIRPRDAGADEP